MNRPTVALNLLSEQELREDPYPQWPFRLVLNDFIQPQPDGSFVRKSLTVGLSSGILADLLAQGHAHQQSYALRVLRQGQDRRAAAEAAVSIPVDPQAMLRRVLSGLRRLPDAAPGEVPAA